MENQNLNQEKRTQVKVRSSHDGKWLIFRVEGFEQPIILAVNYLKAIIESAEKRKTQGPFNVEQIKG